jgi:hypothetical protein
MNTRESLDLVGDDSRHARRRRRARLVYNIVDWVFYASLLLFALLAFKTFLDLVTPYMIWS